MRGVLLASIAFVLVGSSVAAQNRKSIRFWNLTLYTVTSFQMSPAGKDSWGPDQCKNDRDGTVDHDERLRITGVEPGRYDVKLADKIGRVCIVRNVEVKDGAVFFCWKTLRLRPGKAPAAHVRAADPPSHRRFLGRSQLRSGRKSPRRLGNVGGDRIHQGR